MKRCLKSVLIIASAMACGSILAQDPLPTEQDSDANVALEKARVSYTAFLELAAPDDPRRLSVLRRLADIELETAEQLMVDGDAQDDVEKRYRHAIALYQDLINSHPDYEDIDAVYYQLARALDAVTETEQSRQVLEQLIRIKPASGFAGESEFRRGETLFSAGEYAAAAQAYGQVISRSKDTSSAQAFLEQSWYKQGWAYFKLSDLEDSRVSFIHLLRHTLAPQGSYDSDVYDAMTPGNREMLSDAMRAMSLGFSYGDAAQELTGFLSREPAPGFEHMLYANLGELFRTEERFHDAAQVYRGFVVSRPHNKFAPLLMLEVVTTYRAAGFADEELAARKDFVTRFALNQPQSVDNYWQHHKPAEQEQVVTALKTHLTELTQLYHAQAQQKKSALAYTEAIQWYRAWLTSFPAAPESPETHFLLAELLFDSEDFSAAVDAYEQVAYGYDSHERAEQAAYAALVAYDNEAVKRGSEVHSPWVRRSIDAALKFAGTFPQHENATAVQTHAAEQLFERDELVEAIVEAERLLEWQPQPTPGQQKTAWIVVGHAYFDQEDYLRSENAYQQALTLLDPTAPEQAEVSERLAASVYRQAEQKRSDGLWLEAATDFARIRGLVPGSTLLASAEYEAGVAFMEAGSFAKAATAFTRFRDEHPGHELQGEVTRNLSVSYIESGQSGAAATELMRLAADTATSNTDRIAATYQAIDLFAKANEQENILSSYVYLAEALPLQLDESIQVREKIAGIFQKMGNESQQFQWLESIIATNAQAGVAATSRSRTAAARATLLFAMQEWDGFAQVRLVEPLRDSLKEKSRRMESLLAKLGAAAGFEVGPVTTAATYQIGAAYAEMAQALLTSDRPANLTVEELEEYEFLLEEQAFPFEEQAIDIHENNARRVEEGLYDTWVKKSFADLAEFMPGRYQKIEKGVSIADLLD